MIGNLGWAFGVCMARMRPVLHEKPLQAKRSHSMQKTTREIKGNENIKQKINTYILNDRMSDAWFC